MKKSNLNNLIAVLVASLVAFTFVFATRASYPTTTSSNAAPRYYNMSSAVDGKTVGDTTVVNTGDGEFRVASISIEPINVAGLVLPATVSVGSNSPNYNNILTLSTVGGIADTISVVLPNGSKVIPANTDIKVRVVTAATATTQNFKVFLFGHTGETF